MSVTSISQRRPVQPFSVGSTTPAPVRAPQQPVAAEMAAPLPARASAAQAATARARHHAMGSHVQAHVQARSTASTGSPTLAQVKAGTATIHRGNHGAPVKSVQAMLNKHGANPHVTVDGDFGPKTEAGVKAFQHKNHLPTTGRVDARTLKALEAPAHVDATLPRTGNAFIDKYMADAVATQKATGVPASVTMAQAILESGWGRSGLTERANNFFGIKGTGPAGSVTVRTREEDSHGNSYYVNAPFRKYHNATESFTDHARLLSTSSRYHTAMTHKGNAEQFARDIQRAGYATAHNYADTLISIMRQYHLEQFDRFGR